MVPLLMKWLLWLAVLLVVVSLRKLLRRRNGAKDIRPDSNERCE